MSNKRRANFRGKYVRSERGARDVSSTKVEMLLVVVTGNIDRRFVYGLCEPVYMTTAVVGRIIG